MVGFSHFQYYGQWYEITKFHASFEAGQRCNSARYYPKDNGHFGVFNYGIDSQ